MGLYLNRIASNIVDGTVVPEDLNTPSTPSNGQFLGYNNGIMSWQDVNTTTTIDSITTSSTPTSSTEFLNYNRDISSLTWVDPKKIAYDLRNLQDGEYFGDILIEYIYEDGNLYDLLYMTTFGYKTARADIIDAVLEMPACAMRLETGTGYKKVLISGHIKNNSWNFTKGNNLYLSNSTYGGIMMYLSINYYCQQIGIAKSNNIIQFNPNLWYIKVGGS